MHEQPLDFLLPQLPQDLLEFGPGRLQFLDGLLLLGPRAAAFGVVELVAGGPHPLLRLLQLPPGAAGPRRLVVAGDRRLAGLGLGRFIAPLLAALLLTAALPRLAGWGLRFVATRL